MSVGASWSGSRFHSPSTEPRITQHSVAYRRPAPPRESSAVFVFHYHLLTSHVRDVEARYVGRLGFELLARYGRIGEQNVSIEPGTGWDELDAQGFRLRLTELQRGAVNIVVQPGNGRVPRVDHIGIVLADDDFEAALARASAWNLPVSERGGRRTFVSTNAGYRVELHPPGLRIDELLDRSDELRLLELQLVAEDPELKANMLADLLGVLPADGVVPIGDTVVRFLAGGPEGRPQLLGERFG